jgi:hypothetical protein
VRRGEISPAKIEKKSRSAVARFKRACFGSSVVSPAIFIVHFVGPLCREWPEIPETARFDKVFDKGSRQSGLNRWFWDKL